MKVEFLVPDKKYLNPDGFIKAVTSAVDSMAEAALIDFQVTTRTWTNKPLFELSDKSTKKRIEKIVCTYSRIYRYVALGTSVRRAVMSKNFRAKTVVESIRSRVGKGGMVFFSRKISLPGIKARNFHKVIAKKWTPKYYKAIQKAIMIEARRQGALPPKVTTITTK